MRIYGRHLLISRLRSATQRRWWAWAWVSCNFSGILHSYPCLQWERSHKLGHSELGYNLSLFFKKTQAIQVKHAHRFVGWNVYSTLLQCYRWPQPCETGLGQPSNRCQSRPDVIIVYFSESYPKGLSPCWLLLPQGSLLSHKCNMFILFLQCLCNHPIFLLRFLFFTRTNGLILT